MQFYEISDKKSKQSDNLHGFDIVTRGMLVQLLFFPVACLTKALQNRSKLREKRPSSISEEKRRITLP